jgi:hypothetical protein
LLQVHLDWEDIDAAFEGNPKVTGHKEMNRHVWPTWLALYAGGTIWLAFVVMMMVLRVQNSPRGVPTEIVMGLIIVTLVFGVGAVAITSAMRPSALRRSALRAADPDALVQNVRKDQLAQALGDLSIDAPKGWQTYYLTATADSSGLSLWSGSRTPEKLIAFGWDQVRDIALGAVLGTLPFWAVNVTVSRQSTNDVIIPLVFSSEPLGGMYPVFSGGAARLADELATRRGATRRARA